MHSGTNPGVLTIRRGPPGTNRAPRRRRPAPARGRVRHGWRLTHPPWTTVAPCHAAARPRRPSRSRNAPVAWRAALALHPAAPAATGRRNRAQGRLGRWGALRKTHGRRRHPAVVYAVNSSSGPFSPRSDGCEVHPKVSYAGRDASLPGPAVSKRPWFRRWYFPIERLRRGFDLG